MLEEESIMVAKTQQQVVGAGTLKIIISATNIKQESESGQEVGQGYKLSKPTLSDGLPPARSNL